MDRNKKSDGIADRLLSMLVNSQLKNGIGGDIGPAHLSFLMTAAEGEAFSSETTREQRG